MPKISACLVTWNEEKNIERSINSVKPYVDEIIVVDMGSDRTEALSRQLGAKVYKHKYTGFVEPARNFGIKKATGDWIFILDADEEITPGLGEKLRLLANGSPTFYEIARKNIIFGRWIKYTRYWPDYIIRFFKKGSVSWPNQIHRQPNPEGERGKVGAQEDCSIIHHHYQSIGQFVERLNRYTDHQLELLIETKKFTWLSLVRAPVDEFVSRFYFGEGYKDGLHGLAISLLQATSELVLHLKYWEHMKFTSIEPSTEFKKQTEAEIGSSVKKLYYWKASTGNLVQKIKSKLVDLFV